MHLKIAMLGYGHVARELARLLLRKAEVLERDYNLTFSVTGIATQSRGYAINPDGLDLAEAVAVIDASNSLNTLNRVASIADTSAFLRACPADLIMEATWLNPQTGQPATDYVRTALNMGRHVVTANKGPVAFAYRELSELARQKKCGFFFESTVMDGAPVLVVGREALLAATVTRIRGILNSTTNYILSSLEKGIALETAIAETQRIGIMESDPSNDLEGWDAAVKTVVLANVLMGADLRPTDVDRTGIVGLTAADARAAVASGERLKLLCEAVRDGNTVRSSVQPVRLPLSDPLSHVGQSSSAVTIETDTLPQITIVEGVTDPSTTAYGMLVDMINIARGRYRIGEE